MTVEFETYNPSAPRRWWPKEITSKAWEYDAFINMTSAFVFNAPDLDAAVAFAKQHGATMLHRGKAVKPIFVRKAG